MSELVHLEATIGWLKHKHIYSIAGDTVKYADLIKLFEDLQKAMEIDVSSAADDIVEVIEEWAR